MREFQRGHDYTNVQAQENACMHLGDSYTAETMISQQLVHPTGTEEDNKWVQLLEALAFEYMDTRLASISAAQGDTCRWPFHTEEYKGWRQGSRRSRCRFLWIKGKPGAGKSTMMRLAFDRASKDFGETCESIIAGYFFNARGHSIAKSTQGMYRSLLHQIFSKLKKVPAGIPPMSDAASLKEHGWSIPVLQNTLRTVILHLGETYSPVCYIDALDECAEDDIREAIHQFEELASLAMTRNTRFLICFASRHYPTITTRHHRAIDLDNHTGHQQDISDYVSSALRITGPLGDELQRSILGRSAGVFLWAVLTVRILNKLSDHGGTRTQLRGRLNEVPSGVQSLFNEILREGDIHLLPTLQWVLFAERPLTISELYFAVMASVGMQPTAIWDEAEINFEGRRRFIVASSKGLVNFSKPSSHTTTGLSSEPTTHLFHESLREYLLQGGLAELDSSLQGNIDALIHARLAKACQSYISIEQQRFKPESCLANGYSFGECAASTSLHHMYIAFTHDALPHEVLEQFASCWLTSNLNIEQSSHTGRQHCAILLCLSLATTWQQISTDDRRNMLALEDVMVTRWMRDLPHPRGLEQWSSSRDREMLPLFHAAVDAGSVDILQLCARQGWKALFALLLPDALIFACTLGLTGVLDLLLDCLAGAKGSHVFHGTMLQSAAVNLQESVTQSLLGRGMKPDATVTHTMARSSEWTCLTEGTEETRLRIMTALLNGGTDITGVQFNECAIKGCRILELLKERGAQINYCTKVAHASKGTCEHTEKLSQMVPRRGRYRPKR